MKSHVKISLELLQVLYKDLCSMCDAAVDQRDLDRLRARTEHEGDSFLTITMPTLGADLEKALERGRTEPASFAAFGKKGKIPRLFGVFLARVFSTTGELLPDPDPNAIWAIRQLAYAFKKRKELCHVQKIEKAKQEYKEIEQQLADFQVRSDDLADFSKISHLIWDDVLAHIRIYETVPRHGPGATADGITGNSKFVIRQWHDRLEPFFPLLDFGYPTISAYDSEYFRRCKMIEEKDELPVKVIAVPKTAKKPRIIAEEPVCMQYCQQALARPIISAIEQHEITGGHVNFTDQTCNRTHAQQSSLTRRNGTLDLSNASEWIRADIALTMFDGNPDLRDAIQACRSQNAKLGEKDIVPLSKFASMGSALCFPVEAMFFYTICVLGVVRSTNSPLEYAAVIKAARSIYVYGDDLVVPVEHASAVIRALTAFCCKVNYSKSFTDGYFRESCGMDAYRGVDVTPIYFRQRLPEHRHDTPGVLSSIATSNLFYRKGLWLTATAIKTIVEKVIGKLPVVGETCAGVGWTSFTYETPYNDMPLPPKYRWFNGHRARWNRKLHRYECRTYEVRAKMKMSRIDDYPALCRFMLAPFEGEPVERDNERCARRGAATLKYRWLAFQ